MREKPFSEGFSDEKLASIGITSFGYIKTADIPFSAEVRSFCDGSTGKGCGNFEKSWACPPAVGTFEECRAELLGYERGLVFAAVYTLEDEFDFEAMKRGHADFKRITDALYEKLERPFIILSNEGCRRCDACTYPDAPCRFPDMLFPSLEGYCVLVGQLAKAAGMKYNNGKNTVTFFGLVCFS